MFGGCLVACLHVGAGQIGVDELVVGFEFFGFMAFGDGGGVIALGIIRAAEGELGVEIIRVLREDFAQLLNCAFDIAGAEFKHGVVELVLKAWHLAWTTYTIWAVWKRRIIK